MDHSNSVSSNVPSPSNGSRPSSSAPFAYQTRLLERTASRGGGSSLSRSNSQSSINILTNTTGSSLGSVAPRRWAPSHRVGNSLDIVRGKWEERSRDASLEDSPNPNTSPSKESSRLRSSTVSTHSTSSSTLSNQGLLDRDRPLTPPSLTSSATKDSYTTPKYLKRQTLPAPIIASPLSPNSTGVSVEADSPMSVTPHRIHIPQLSPTKTPSWHVSTPDISSKVSTRQDASPIGSSYAPKQRAHTLDSNTPQWLSSTGLRKDSTTSKTPQEENSFSSSSLDHNVHPDRSSMNRSTERLPIHRVYPRPLSRNGSITSLVDPPSPSVPKSPPPNSSGPSPMFPTPYRSSYMANKKADSYSEALSVSGKRKLGNHLPRIASGDADETWVDRSKPVPKTSEDPPTRRARMLRKRDINVDEQKQTLTPSGVLQSDGVAGLPGRIPLKAPNLAAPTPSSRLLGGSWADKQRHLLHAYEYLCHVGEAQQWIEGCLGEELEFGVVELEDGLRNGVVLAKLVRAFMGEAHVKRIYEVSEVCDQVDLF